MTRQIVSDRWLTKAEFSALRLDYRACLTPQRQQRLECDRRAFALVAAAGTLAEDLGVLTWTLGDAKEAARHCFNDWLRDRGGKEAGEDRDALAQVRLFMEKNGDARFQKIFEKALDDGTVIDPDRPVVNRAGYRRGGEWWVFPQVWEDEICEGRDAKAIAKMLEAKKILTRPASAKGSTYQSVRKVDGKNIRCYVLTAMLFDGDPESDQSDPSIENDPSTEGTLL